MKTSAFVAFQSGIVHVREAIQRAIEKSNNPSSPISLNSWEELDIPGHFIATEVLNNISDADILIADITRLNFNVTYEIGFAIGKGKRVVIIRNSALRQEGPRLEEVGIFDTLGYKDYTNGDQLFEILTESLDVRPIPITNQRNIKAPIYLIQPAHRTDFDTQIVSAIKKSHLYFRSFDPTETTRLPAPEAIQNVAESYGIILHFISDDLADAKIHNLRSAFVAGLSDGLDRPSVFIQSGANPIPIDYRDFVKQCTHPSHFKEAVADLAERAIESIQECSAPEIERELGLLESLDLGASAAENEITSLSEYFIEIDAYRRALRHEVRLVTGRKGSGKTAIFFRLRDVKRANKKNVVLDLKPDGYQLLKFKDSIVGLMSVGTSEHTITAFWEYLLWLEICHKLLEKDRELHKRDHRIFELYNRLQATYSTNEYSSEGDFSERLRVLLQDIIAEIDARYSKQEGLELTTAQVTELVYRHDFTKLRELIEEYLSYKSEVWLLFDNIDKGWPAHGVTESDLVIIRALIEATRKIERYLNRKDLNAQTVVFLRNDIFEHLVSSTADRGKETRANVDWDDADLLRELLRRRIIRCEPGLSEQDFHTIWRQLCAPLIEGEESSQYLIDRCLMRPRGLLDLIGHCRGYAVNLGHEKITKSDISKGFYAFSNDLLVELGLEIRDVFPIAENVLYAFIGANSHLDRQTLVNLIESNGYKGEEAESLIKLLLWFGFLGFLWTDGKPRYIYSFNYNMKVLEGAHAQLQNGTLTYIINPSFEPALGLTTTNSIF